MTTYTITASYRAQDPLISETLVGATLAQAKALGADLARSCYVGEGFVRVELERAGYELPLPVCEARVTSGTLRWVNL